MAQTISEYDLTSAYGHAASQILAPSGFSTGYQQQSQPLLQQQEPFKNRLERLDKRARHRSFEFRAVYKFIDDLTRRQGVRVRSLYHNYSGLGIFTLGKYNLDLAVVTEDGRLLLVNMDGQFAHGCSKCLSSPLAAAWGRFVNGQTHEQVRAKTEQRDVDINAWVRAFNAGLGSDVAYYTVLCDCHSPGFTTQDLEDDFRNEPTLKALVRGYQVTDQCGGWIDKDSFGRLMQAHANDTSFTFVAKARVSILNRRRCHQEDEEDKEDEADVGPLVVYDQDIHAHANPAAGHSRDKEDEDDDDSLRTTTDGRSKKTVHQRLAWQGTVVLTRDYYQWLLQTFGPDGFQLQHLDFVLFYKTEPAINEVYRQLVDLRACTLDPVQKTFIKRLVNLSAGYFGCRSTQLNTKTTYRIVNRLPRNYAFYRHSADMRYTMDLKDDSFFLLETKPWPCLGYGRGPSKSGVPLFLAIVEYGKLRLVQILHFLREHLQPGSFWLVYSNIDNLILALSTPTLEEAVLEARLESFRTQRDLFFSAEGTKIPGRAELKWSVEKDWKFITLRTQHYCLASTNKDVHKVSGLSRLGSQEAFAYAERQLAGLRVDIPQERRLRKMGGLQTESKVFHY